MLKGQRFLNTGFGLIASGLGCLAMSGTGLAVHGLPEDHHTEDVASRAFEITGASQRGAEMHGEPAESPRNK